MIVQISQNTLNSYAGHGYSTLGPRPAEGTLCAGACYPRSQNGAACQLAPLDFHSRPICIACSVVARTRFCRVKQGQHQSKPSPHSCPARHRAIVKEGTRFSLTPTPKALKGSASENRDGHFWRQPRSERQAIHLETAYPASDDTAPSLVAFVISRLGKGQRRPRCALPAQCLRAGLRRTSRFHGRPGGQPDALSANARVSRSVWRIFRWLFVWSEHECILCRLPGGTHFTYGGLESPTAGPNV